MLSESVHTRRIYYSFNIEYCTHVTSLIPACARIAAAVTTRRQAAASHLHLRAATEAGTAAEPAPQLAAMEVRSALEAQLQEAREEATQWNQIQQGVELNTSAEQQLAALMELGFHAQMAAPLCDGVSPVEDLVEQLTSLNESGGTSYAEEMGSTLDDGGYPGAARTLGGAPPRRWSGVARRFGLHR